MMFLAAQGDVLIEKVADHDGRAGTSNEPELASAIVARGERSGHAHRLKGSFVFFRDEALAKDVPTNLYVAHAHVRGAGARLIHEEHGPIELASGTYRFRLQRHLEPTDGDFSDPYGVAGD
jgi:hypothetical protein